MFKHQGPAPFPGVAILNQVAIQDGYHLSYNPSSRDYGCDTTAIVFGETLFFVLNGDHREALGAAVQRGGKQAVIDYFIENVGQANRLSEHTGIFREDHPFRLGEHAAVHFGPGNIARLQAAMQAGREPAPEELPGP
ncbi:hypothetical protein LAZ40_11245 [Cereibacter sphaeroides]|uniref:hypothetical protein n=1 Tax=Cereibacter sphaeroides TaxID=1063 RepID=UPI001F2FB3ED|nr:hypothetical protein [Cereibacter sphaeroides]MCE6959620.1 hypothetical protein [Cereibacter sphaeroides]MCE6974520.1 hypothetical protein [Cereibacter sphaeroides]